MRKILFVALLAVASVSSAQPRGPHGGPGYYNGGGCYNCNRNWNGYNNWNGNAAGWAAAGLVIGAIAATAAVAQPVYVAPQPVYVAPPIPTNCVYVKTYDAWGQLISTRPVCQ